MWEKVKLGDVCEIVAGQSPSSNTYNQEKKGLPFFQGKADFGLIYPTVRYWCTSPIKISEPNDILFSLRAPVGPTNINNIKACIGRGLAAIRIASQINLYYLLHYLRLNENRIAELGTGSTFKAITIGTLKELEIPLPPLPIQEKIAEILDKADELRRKDKDLQAKYDELAQAIFIDMFGDPVRNEKGWEVKNGINVLSVLGGNAFKSSSYVNAGIPLLRIGSVNKGYYDKSQQVYISESSNFDKYKIYPNDLLVTLTGTVGKDDYGNICMIGHDFPFYYLNQRVAKITTDLNKTYLMYLLKQKEIKKELIGVSRGVRQANIGNNDFYKLNLPVPPLHLQQSFAKKIELINQLKAQTNAEKSEELFQSLLQKAFKGELVS
ncbi:restriction endonuclease subunit S [Sphingobacterium siyangense]|uniref:restriction endonuclease subunit S n=1 Tax=Sphingobacterium siyangense TaxID=459529 RepID=UPI002FDD40BD